MPLPPPVTIAVLPDRSKSSLTRIDQAETSSRGKTAAHAMPSSTTKKHTAVRQGQAPFAPTGASDQPHQFPFMGSLMHDRHGFECLG